VNTTHLSKGQPGRARRGWVRPRFALASAALAVAGASWAALAAPASKTKPVPMSSSASSASGRASSRGPVKLSDLPEMVARYGQMRRASTNAKSISTPGVSSSRLVGTGRNGFNLTEVDLTPNSPSDEREPAVSPTGGFIAFRSNGADRNGDGTIDSVDANGKYHIWVMNSDGTNQRQLTGLTPTLNGVVGGDVARNQFHPSWSPDGNQLVYADEDTDPASNNAGGTQLFVVNPLAGGAPSQRTFSPGLKQAPAWSPNGLTIAFSSNTDITATPAQGIAGGRSLFSISPDGTGAARLTSGADDSNPSFGVVNTGTLYFSSNLDTANGILPTGRRIWGLFPGNPGRVQVSDPTLRANGAATDIDDYPADSSVAGPVREQLGFQTNSLIDASDTRRDFNIWSLPSPASSAETSGRAQVLTNILSSPTNFNNSGLVAPQGEDTAGDGEESFGRSVVGTTQQIARLYFVSGRKYTPTPTSTVSNPSGGSEVGASDLNSGVAHDIWTTSTQDTTPPTLIPQAAGNSLYPVVAPSPASPFPAPRTFETGLRAGGILHFGVVLRDRESGISPNGVTVSFSNAAAPNFLTITSKGVNKDGKPTAINAVNADIAEDLSLETKPTAVASYTLTAYDDGPASAGGHEQEANAVAGDGDFYCAGDLTTPTTPGDYYIDVSTTDRVGNRLNYDNVWGFSTQPFVHSNNGTSDLFVSDYTCGQRFPFQVGSGFSYSTDPNYPDFDFGRGDGRFTGMLPVESYYLNNPSTPATGKDLKPLDVDDKGKATGAFSTTPEPVTFGAPTLSDRSSGSRYLTGSNSGVDVWRVLCRGPVPQSLLNTYLPSTSLEIDPNNPNAIPDPVAGATPTPTPKAGATPTAFSQPTRKVAVAKSSVIWAAPYAGEVFAGPGTIADATTQNNLTNFLNAGGRLFVGGRDVAFALSSGGSSSNTFLNNELGAKLAGVDIPNSIRYATATADGLLDTTAPPSDPGYYGDFANLQFPLLTVRDNLNHENDGAGPRGVVSNTDGNVFYGSGNAFADPLTPNPGGGATVKTAYSSAVGAVGLKIERLRSNGLPSRAVFFSFGMESVNRRYRARTDDDGRISLNTRRALASGILAYFKTTSISGTVINNSTNLPVANFLVRVDGADGVHLVRTDANGNYSFLGLITGKNTVQPYLDSNKITSPPGFFGGTAVFFILRGGDGGVGGVILRVTPAVPGTVTGKVVRVVNKTNAPINNLPVLIRSTAPSPLFPSGGIFSALTLTNGDGNYTFSGVPAAANMEVVFNPDPRPRSQGGDVPDGASLPVFTKSTQYLTRIVPQTGDKTRSGDIIVPTSGVFVVDDILNDTAADESTPIVLAIDPNNGVAPTPTPPPGGGGGGGGTNPTPTPVAPTGTGPTFAVGRSYAISLPYETSANANSRNLFDRSDADATISITDAFNYAPTEGANTLYTVSRFDVNTLTYIQLPDDALLHRGEGYLLTVSKLPQSALPLQLNTRLENATLLPLTQEPNKNQFSVQLSVNTSLSGNTLAGNNLIGFGFDPTQFGSVAWDTTTADPNASSVTVTSGTRTYSLAQAVGNAPIDRLGTRISLLASSLTTIDNTDTTKPGVAKAVNSLSAFGGYFVVAKKDGLRLTFKNPSTAIGAGTTIKENTSFAFTLPFATTPDAAGTVPVSSAFAAGSTGYTVYAFNVFGQTGARKTVPGNEFIPLSSGDLLKRGVGYVVKTGSTPVMLNTSATSAGLVPFNGPTFEIPLGRNANFPGGLAASARNGYNLIGSPFNPSTTSNISFANNVRVTATVGSKTYTSISIKEAAARGIISNRLYTHDETGNLTPVPLNDQFLRAYRGYFVQVFKDNVKLTLTAPAK